LTIASEALWDHPGEEKIVRILVIEDDLETAEYVVEGLQSEGHQLEVSMDGRAALLRAVSDTWDLLIVDRMLPGLDGLAVVRTLRASGITTPVLFLTTMGGLDDRVSGLNAGGDDYLVKPFAFAELVARVAALGRRPHRVAPDTVLRVADLEMDLLTRVVQRGGQLIELQPREYELLEYLMKHADQEVDLLTRVVRRGGQQVELQPREYELLEYLMKHADQVVTRTMLLEHVWGFHFDPRTSLVESHISRLRGKIDRGRTELINTVRGSGYCIRASA
jgi:two-component system OmpR family response regulator